ncbi:MAG: hypothetical protein KF767_18040 [Bdellovibrionaceae bacterium]|nr:hypothetical protein [Pseudobdellovibrionaceae bacterium]
MKYVPALIGFFLALAVGLKVVAETATAPSGEVKPEITGKVGDCATTQPELRKLFPIEMRILKNFEGIVSSTPYKDYKARPHDRSARVFLFNANKKEIRIQTDITNDVGDAETSKAHLVKVCKSEGGMVIHMNGQEIPIMVLSNQQIRMKYNGTWFPFFRIQEIISGFMPEGTRQWGKAGVTPPAADRTRTATEPAATEAESKALGTR